MGLKLLGEGLQVASHAHIESFLSSDTDFYACKLKDLLFAFKACDVKYSEVYLSR